MTPTPRSLRDEWEPDYRHFRSRADIAAEELTDADREESREMWGGAR